MKVSAILQRKKQAEEQSASKTNPLLVSFKDGEEYRVRFLPNKEIGEMGAIPVWVHYPNAKIVNKPMISPVTFNETDPVLDFVQATINDGNLSKEDFKSVAGKAPRLSYFVPVIVRGKEDEGVKFLSLSGGPRLNSLPWAEEGQWGRIVKLIEALAKEEDANCDISSIKDGFDLIISVTGKDKSSTGYREFDYHLARKATPLGTKEQATKILQNQPSWKDIYPIATAEYLQTALDKHFSAGNDSPDLDDDDLTTTDTTPASQYDEAEIQRQAEEAFKNVGVPSTTDDLDDLDAIAESATTTNSTTDDSDFDSIDF